MIDMACLRFLRPWQLHGDVNGDDDEVVVRCGSREATTNQWIEGRESKFDRKIRDG